MSICLSGSAIGRGVLSPCTGKSRPFSMAKAEGAGASSTQDLDVQAA